MDRIDEKDLQIIEILSSNARISLRDIEKKVSLSPSSIRIRMENLVKSGVIKRYTVDVDHKKMGYEIHVLLLITSRPNVSKELYLTLSKIEQISEVLRTTGSTNFILRLRLHNLAELTQFITNHIERLDGIEKVETLLILDE